MTTQHQRMVQAEPAWHAIKSFLDGLESKRVYLVQAQAVGLFTVNGERVDGPRLEQLLADHFGVDLLELEREHREMAEQLRRAYGVEQ